MNTSRTVPLGQEIPAAVRLLNGAALALPPVLIFSVLFGLWELSIRMSLVPAFVLPAPSDILTRLIGDIGQDTVWTDLAYTLTEVVAGFLVALLAGLWLGAMVALVPFLDRLISPLVVALQTIPKVAVAPLLIIWLGFGIESKIVLVALIDFFPIFVNAVAGFRNVDKRQLLLMKILKASKLQILFKVRMFNALPYLVAGMKIAIVLSVIGAVVGEFLGAARGLGAQVAQRQAAMDVVGVFSILAILSVMGIVLNAAMNVVGRRAAYWTEQEEPRGL